MIDRRHLGMTGTATLARVLAQPVLAQATLTNPKTEAADAQAGSKAPAATDSGAGLTDIIVTATRRDSRLQTTPIAVTAIDQSLIKQSNPRSIGDLAQFVPNFSAATITGFNAASFSIRGVGQNTIIVYFEPPVAVLVDDFVVPSVQTQLLDIFDVSQVEVLRGPQGTLFGKNTSGGAVAVKIKPPVLNDISAEGRVTEYRYNMLIKRFASRPEPPFESKSEQEFIWGRHWGCSNDIGQLRVVMMHRL